MESCAGKQTRREFDSSYKVDSSSVLLLTLEDDALLMGIMGGTYFALRFSDARLVWERVCSGRGQRGRQVAW